MTGAPTPASPGTNQNVTVSGLSGNTTYYFALKTSNAHPNWSAISNVPSATTLSQTCTWTGSVSQLWSVAGNWNPAVVPGAGMIGLINVSSPYPITDADLAGAPSIQVATGGLVSHKGGITLTTPVTLSGGTWRLTDSWTGSTLNASLTVTTPSTMDGVRGTSLGISGALAGTALLTFRGTDNYLGDGPDWTISSSNNTFSGGILIDSGNNPNLWANASRALGTGDITVRSTGTLIFGANQDYSGASRTPVLYLESGATSMSDHLNGVAIPFNVVVQSQGGTLGAGTWATNNTYSGSITLNGPLTLAGSRGNTGSIGYTITGQISGGSTVTVNTTDQYQGDSQHRCSGQCRQQLQRRHDSTDGLSHGHQRRRLSTGPLTLYNPDSMTNLCLDKPTDANWTIANTLYGAGTIQVEGGTGYALTTSGSISPGVGAGNVGTLTIQGNLGLAAGATLAVDLNAVDIQNPAADLLAVTGSVSNLSNATLNMSVTGDANTISGRQFTILTCANDLTGQTFGSVTVPTGWNKTMVYGNGSIKVTLNQSTITFANNTLTYGSPSDLGTTIDPAGLNDVATSYGITKAAFQALNPQVVAFNGAPAPTQALRTLVAYYTTGNTVTFTFPAAMYNYGSYGSLGRGAFSGTSLQDAISTVPTQPDSLYDWFDATITSTGQGVTAIGFCAAFRNDQSVAAGQVLYTLSDSTTGSVSLPALGGAGNPEYVFIGYQAPTGKTITRVQASRTSAAGGGYVSVDDLSFVIGGTDTTPPAAVTNLSCNNLTTTSIQLNWTAPGDDGNTGTATTYNIRYSTSAINDANFASATQVTGVPAPAAAGTNQNVTVSGLTADTTYYFAMKTADEVPNWSAISNVPSAHTVDSVAPAAVSNLATSSPTNASITLSWTAPGDNGSTGTATTYDIRYSTSTINDANFSSATQVSGVPAPAAAGTNQNMTVSGLNSGTTYYFAMKTADEVPNWSAISNVASGTTTSPADTTPPAAVTNLATSSPTNTTITLTWTAPGDDGNTGTATSYDIRYSTSTITAGNFSSATQVSGVPAPLVAGTNQSVTVSGLTANTTYYFAMKTADEVPNWSTISNVPSGTTTNTSGNNNPVLTPKDFKYLGYYELPTGVGGGELNYGQGFTVRYVGGQLRFLTLTYDHTFGHRLIEFAPPSSFGGAVSGTTNVWPDIWTGTGLTDGGVWLGLWYEAANSRLWTTWAIDYPNDQQCPYTVSLAVRTLNADGTISNAAGPWGLQGIGDRMIYGGMQAVPSWFQSTYGTGALRRLGRVCQPHDFGPVLPRAHDVCVPRPDGLHSGREQHPDFVLQDHHGSQRRDRQPRLVRQRGSDIV